MANIVRTAKSGSDWNCTELMAYNITVSSLPAGEFFPGPDPPLDHIDPAILNFPPGGLEPGLSSVAGGYLGYLDLAANAIQECFVDDFATETLKLLGFDECDALVAMRFIIPLSICGKADHIAQTDVCLLHLRSTLILLVLAQDKTLNRNDAESQVVAGAIAAFQFNNGKREELGLNPLDAMAIPCITMSRTRPTFYLVPVTTELSNAVIAGQYPATQTQVLRCLTLETHQRRVFTGMEDTEYRKLALKRFLAFKALARSHWAHISEGV